MFASGISSSAQQSIASFQAQQQQKAAQQFRSLAAQFQSQQTPPANSPAAAIPPANDAEPGAQTGPAHFHHRPHIHMEPGASGTSSQANDPQIGDPTVPALQSASPFSAQQAYTTLGQSLQQDLGSAVTTAEVGAQTSSLSLMV